MIRALLVLLSTLLPASAETAQVLSGEHGDFTRLVIELPTADSWILGRTVEGYAFAAAGDSQPDYNLDRVWLRIDRNRLTSLATDPASGALQLALGCDCHVFPFEYQPGIVVLDIKPGPAPAASAFEAAFAPTGPAAPTDAEAQPAKTYDWVARAGTDASRSVATLPLPLETGNVSLKPLRDELLEQIAQGAANGIVDMELPGNPLDVTEVERSTPWSNIHIGEAPGLIVTEPNALIEDARPDAACAAPDLLELPTWAGDLPPHEVLAETRNGLFGEFDVAEEKSVLRAVRLLLYLGFGAEARQTAGLVVPEDESEELSLYRSMARLVDGESDPKSPFAAMLGCDGPAALWAALAHDQLPAGPAVNRDAIIQAFQALPSHLRSHLGPALAEKLLAHDDSDAARMIRDAMERAPDADKAAVALLDAKSDLHEGDAEGALVHAEAAVALDGDKADNLVELVEVHFHKLQPLGPEVAEALLALQGEHQGTNAGQDIDRAIVLALALSDQIDAAFAEGGQGRGTVADLWRVIQARAADDDFLRQAVPGADVPQPEVDSDVKSAIAQRLLALGFPDAALAWLGSVAATDVPELRLLAAKAETARGNAEAASDLLAGLQGGEAEALRAKVMLQLGDFATAGAALASTGDAEAAARLDLWSGDWASLDPNAPMPWQKAAEFVKPTPTEEATGLLDRSSKTVDASLASRSAIEALLASVPSPTAN